MKRGRTKTDLKKILGLVPLLHANPGISVSELAKVAGYASKKELRESIEKLMMFGVPPFSPSDFIEVSIDDEDRVYLEFPQGLDRPLALTSAEWTALYRAVKSAMEFRLAGEKPREELSGIVSKLAAFPVEFDSEKLFSARRTVIEEALEDSLQIEFRYRTLASKEMEIRRIDPWALFHHRGASYVIGYCYLRRDARYFHLERMEDIEILDMEQTSSVPENLREILSQSPIFDAGLQGFQAQIAFDPQLAGAVTAHFGARDIHNIKEGEAPAGWKKAVCSIQESIWFRTMVRSMGPSIMILSPAHLRESHLKELKEIPLPGLL